MLELKMVSLDEIALTENIRKDAKISDAFVESVKSQGVLVPVLAFKDMLGKISVYDGQRRVKAASMAGLKEIPVLISPDPSSDEVRVSSQYAVNEAREQMSLGEKAAAVEQMALFGMSLEQISAKTGQRLSEIEALRKIRGSRRAVRVVNSTPELTLDQAAKMAEIQESQFLSDEDKREMEKELEDDPESVDHTLQWYLDESERLQKDIEIRAYLAAEGIKLFDAMPSKSVGVWKLRSASGEKIMPEEHESCPGHAYVTFGKVTSKRFLTAVCMNPELHKTAAMLDEERLEKEAELQRKAQERERKQAWKAASAVRLEFVYGLLKALPKGAVEWAIRWAMPKKPYRGVEWELLTPVFLLADAGVLPQGVTAYGWAKATEKGAHTSFVASVFARVEKMMQTEPNVTAYIACADYLQALHKWGYVLSDLEQGIVDAAKGLEE